MAAVKSPWILGPLPALLLAIPAAPAAAQRPVEVGPLLGYYLPTGRYDPATVSSVRLPSRPRDLKGRAWGGETRMWFGARVGLQVQVASSSTDLGPVYTPGGPSGPTSARTTAASVQLLYGLLADPRGHRLWAGAGPGVVRHGGDAYAEVGAQTDVAAVVGLGGRVPLRGGFALTGGVTALVYAYDVPMPAPLGANGESLQRGAQRDALFYAALEWQWRRETPPHARPSTEP